ncbi:TetR/AcrR family transcriptional regulator [Texcoconibacillus texcoconensis]|uniref:AcrR family transcriptional regulator n=1 Tax=Texcoconibacillus texcoconensis TaxID=1095777 RepID=A0A840QTS6_9BACI|nr:TetR/AcrR family transcriptional regulator [Texcoconibacillus texcoconensis]MBB5174691.1 AcrR family transcriptional regulator [Texcoconibacillus texcoconensis]
MKQTEIKQVAIRLFSEHGYEKTSLSDIANEVGIKKPSLYNHFPSKEALFLNIVDDVYDGFINHLKKAISSSDRISNEQKLKAALTSTCSFMSEHHLGKMYMRMMLFPPSHLKELAHERFLECEKKMNELFAPVFENAIQKQEIVNMDIQTCIDGFYCLIDGLSAHMFYYDQSAIDRKIEAVWSVYWVGLSKKSR